MNTNNYLKRMTRVSPQRPLRVLIGIALLAGLATGTGCTSKPEIEGQADVIVYKTLGCTCCTKWADHASKSGLNVEIVNVENTNAIRSHMNIPSEVRSCHTAVAGQYWVEGHVPADLVQRMLDENPSDIVGLAVPGMVIGSPGMEGPNPVEYDIFAYDADGNASVYATRQGQESAE